MTRLLALLILLLIAAHFYQRARLMIARARDGVTKRPNGFGDGAAVPLVACITCGVRLPAASAVANDAERPFCAVACRDRNQDG